MQGLVDNGCVAERKCLHHTFNAGSEGVVLLFCYMGVGKEAFGSCAVQVHLVKGVFSVIVNPISSMCF